MVRSSFGISCLVALLAYSVALCCIELSMFNFLCRTPKYKLPPQYNKNFAVRALNVYGGVEVFLISALDRVVQLFPFHGFLIPGKILFGTR